MKWKSLLAAWLILSLFAACVPNRKYVYLQKEDVNKKNLPKDSVVRQYDMALFDYRLQPNDILSIRAQTLTDQKFDFFSSTQGNANNLNAGVAALNGEMIDEQGEISFPVVGKIKVAGLTVFQTQDTLQKIANRYLESPSIRVRLLNFRFVVLGEVTVEGVHTSFNNRVTLPEAIGLAGGLSEMADRQNIKVIRYNQGRLEVGYVDLLDENAINSPYFFVHQGDTFIVPALRQRPFRTYFRENVTLLVSAISLTLLIINLSNNN